MPLKALEMALDHIKAYIKFRNHDDLDIQEDVSLCLNKESGVCGKKSDLWDISVIFKVERNEKIHSRKIYSNI